MSDLFGVAGTQLLDRLDLPAPYAARIASLRRLMDDLDFEIDLFAGMVRGRMVREPGTPRCRTSPDGPTLAAVFVAEIGDITRSRRAEADLLGRADPQAPRVRYPRPPGSITKQGSRLIRWAAIESVKLVPKTTAVGCSESGCRAPRPQHRQRRRARRQLEFVFYALRDGHVRALEHRPRLA
jgi:hypothetical protein